MSEQVPIEPNRVVEDAELSVRGRLESGEYAAEFLQQLRTPFAGMQAPDQPEELALISSAHPLQASGPLRALNITIKRVVRRLLAWYVHPITVDQSRFNEAIIREVRRLEHRLQVLESGQAAGAGASDEPPPTRPAE